MRSSFSFFIRSFCFFFVVVADKGEDAVSFRLADEVSSNRESTFDGDGSVNPAAGLRAMPLSEHSNTPLHDTPCDLTSRKLDMSWSQQPKDPHSQRGSNLSSLSDTKDPSKWKTNEDPIIKRQLSGIFDSGFEARRVLQTPPEELSLFYKDPQGLIQGPFKGIDIIGWFEAGYFGIDLPVRLESAAADSPWLSLGDAMPHLRAKACPPPGFSVPKPNELTDASGRQNSNAVGNILSGLSEIEMMRNDSRNRQSSGTEAENRFLESLMSGNKNSPPLDGQTLSEGQSYFFPFLKIFPLYNNLDTNILLCIAFFIYRSFRKSVLYLRNLRLDLN